MPNEENTAQPDESKACTDTWKRRVEEAWDRHIALCDTINEVTEQNMERLRASVESMEKQGEA